MAGVQGNGEICLDLGAVEEKELVKEVRRRRFLGV